MPDELDATAGTPLDPDLERLLLRSCAEHVDVETAAGHLWAIHRAAQQAGPTPAPRTGAAGACRSGTGARPVLVALALVALLTTSGAVLAGSGAALPGEALYPVKLSVERVQRVASVGAEHDARLHLDIARRRVAEAGALGAQRPAAVPGLLDAAADALDRAERLAPAQPGAALVREDAGHLLRAVAQARPELLADLQGNAGRLGLRALVLAAPPAAPEPDPGAAAGADEPAAAAPSDEEPGGGQRATAPRRAPLIRRLGPPPTRPGDTPPAPDTTSHAAAPVVAQAPAPAAAPPVPAPAPDAAPPPEPSAPPAAPPPAPSEADGAADAGGGKHLPSMAELASRFEGEG